MTTPFRAPVAQALDDIFYHMREGRGQEGLRLLEEAAAGGDADAMCLLARCLNGSSYVWEGHRFPEDEARATKLMRQAAEQGSALAVLLCLRSGELTPSLKKNMPFANLREAFDRVLAMAESGEPFCQYTVGNVYFWWDFQKIDGKRPSDFPNREAYRDYLWENASRAEDWFWKALRGGVFFAANNLNKLYSEGDEDLIPPRPERCAEVWKAGAEAGLPPCQMQYAWLLREGGDPAGAVRWFREAAEGGDVRGWHSLGTAYYFGQGVEKNAAESAACYERGAAHGNLYSKMMLGQQLYQGLGVEQDYGRAFQLFSEACAGGIDMSTWTWVFEYMGDCLFRGLGAQQNYALARQYLEKSQKPSAQTYYELGCIYGQGLGVEADIPRAVALLEAAGNYRPAQEERLRYKKTLFGKWKRRS